MDNSESLKIKNYRGEVFMLHPNYDEFAVIDVKGFEMPDVENSYSESVAMDGGNHDKSRMQARNLVIWLVIFGDSYSSRRKFYKMFPPKTAIDIYYRNIEYNVHTVGRVDSIDASHFQGKERVRIALTCADPYLYDADERTAQTVGNPPTCIIENGADTELGFVADVEINTDTTPDLKMYVSQSETADYLRAHYINWEINADDEPNFYDLADKTINLYINNNFVSRENYTAKYITVQNFTVNHIMQISSENPIFAGGQRVELEVLSVDGETVNDLRRYTDSVNISVQFAVVSFVKPSSFDSTTNQVNVSWNGEVKTENTDYTLEIDTATIAVRKSDGYFQPGDIVSIEIYSSESGTNIKSMDIERNVLTLSSLPPFADIIIPSLIQHYDSSKDLLRVYMGENLIQNYSVLPVAMPDSTAAIGIFMTGASQYISQKLTYEVIHSISGQDVRAYTESQVDEGLSLVKNLTFTNTTSGDYMAFHSVNFQKGDKFTISTIPGELSVIVTESEWMETNTSLLYDVMRNGSFFKLKPGVNTLQFSADTHDEFVSAEIKFRQKYGGV